MNGRKWRSCCEQSNSFLCLSSFENSPGHVKFALFFLLLSLRLFPRLLTLEVGIPCSLFDTKTSGSHVDVFLYLFLISLLFLPCLLTFKVGVSGSLLDTKTSGSHVDVFLCFFLISLLFLPCLLTFKVGVSGSLLDTKACSSHVHVLRFFLHPSGFFLSCTFYRIYSFCVLFGKSRHTLRMIRVQFCLCFALSFFSFLLFVLLPHSKIERGHTLECIAFVTLWFPFLNVIFRCLEVILRIILLVLHFVAL
mmetsp:Transcript_9230/g.22417  ORF Transcript_9230/g.22417 Transcript_9230/m.22417 type:complete len:250 (+) Transcript_9230:1604-2353(+)